MEKECFNCKKVKPLSDFIKNKAKSSGYYGSCKECVYAKKKKVLSLTSKIIVYDELLLKDELWTNLIYGKEITRFQISNCGRVFNTETKVFVRISNNAEYPIVSLKLSGKIVSKRIHILVGKYFVDNPHGQPILNHKDGNKHNPHFSNLEWTTQKMNRKHAIETGLVSFVKGEGHPLAKLVLNTETGIYYPTLTEACETVNAKTQNVSGMMSRNNSVFIYA